MRTYPVIDANGHLAVNAIWNVPTDTNEVRGTLKTFGPWQIAVSYRALAMDQHGRVFGIRTMSKPRESGYVLEGRVAIESKSYRAFTSSKMFTREDGSLCDVAILYVCGTPDMRYDDPLTVSPDEYRQYCKGIAHRYFYDKDGIYKSLARYCTVLDNLASSDYPDNVWLRDEWRKESLELRAELSPVMGWVESLPAKLKR